MTDIIEQLRLEDAFWEFYEIATNIRNQKLLLDAESESLNRHKKKVEEGEIELLTKTWRSSYWNNFFRHLKNKTLNPIFACRLLRTIDETIALPAYKHINYHFSQMEKLLAIMYNEPHSVAEILNYAEQNDASSNDLIIQAFLQMLYSYGVFPEDELKLSQVVSHLLKLQLSQHGTAMRKMLRKEISMSTRLYKHFVELMHPTMVYLTKALRSGILDVIQLGNFWLDIDAKQSSVRFLHDNMHNEDRLPEYRALVVSKLVDFVDNFLKNIAAALPMLPPNLNWVIREVFCSLEETGACTVELSHACKDMIVSNLFCPAIISPQKYGIVDNDVRIGSIVNHNLVQIAMIIQMISLQEVENPLEDYKEFLSQCRNTHLLSEMINILLVEKLTPDVEIISLFANKTAASDMSSKSSFVGTLSDVNKLMKTINTLPPSVNRQLTRIVSECNKLPAAFVSPIKKISEDFDGVPKASTLRNIHKKVQYSFKKNVKENSQQETESYQSNLFDCDYIEREMFELLHIDYTRKHYTSLNSDLLVTPFALEQKKTPENIPQKLIPASTVTNKSDVISFEESSLNPNEILTNTDEKRKISNKNISMSDASPEKTVSILAPTPENKGNFAKLKFLGEKMKKGIIQSNTFSDLREHLIRSSSTGETNILTTSNSETSLAAAVQCPRNDILAKYQMASVVESKPLKMILKNSINSSPRCDNLEFSEPYYTAERVETCRAFVDTLRKIITVLGNVSYLPRIGSRNNLSEFPTDKKVLLHLFLDGVLVETEHRRDYGQAAQLREIQRCIEIFEEKSVIILIAHLKNNEKEQQKLINDMRSERIRLMRKSNDISSLEQRVTLNRQLAEQLIVDYLIRLFLETGFQQKNTVGKTAEVVAVLNFYDRFQNLEAHDERVEILQNLMQYLKTRLQNNTDWNFATDTMIDRAMTTIERYVLFSVYEIAFYPNPDIDKHRDKLLKDTIGKVLNDVTPNNESLKIPNYLYNEAPWPSAQAELAMLDIYVTAKDKLNCVVRCCDVINNLIALSCKNAVASADDLIPVLVFVIIKANPRALLSNIKYIETYAGTNIESGRDAYYWTNFKAAVEYIKTIL